jgi:hypothetical protein
MLNENGNLAWEETKEGAMVKLFRTLSAILIVAVLIGAPGVQATVTMPCQTTITSAASDPQSASQDQNPTSSPCKQMMPGCTDMLGCGPGAYLSVQDTAVAHNAVETTAAYEVIAASGKGLSVKPYLHPGTKIAKARSLLAASHLRQE